MLDGMHVVLFRRRLRLQMRACVCVSSSSDRRRPLPLFSRSPLGIWSRASPFWVLVVVMWRRASSPSLLVVVAFSFLLCVVSRMSPAACTPPWGLTQPCVVVMIRFGCRSWASVLVLCLVGRVVIRAYRASHVCSYGSVW